MMLLMMTSNNSNNKGRKRSYVVRTCVLFFGFVIGVLNQLQLSAETNYLRIAESSLLQETGIQETGIIVPSSGSSKYNNKLPAIAVCVSGMPERLQPWHALQHLVVANADKVQFHMIYAMGEHTGLTYSSRPDATFESSPYAAYKTTQQLTTQLKSEGMRLGVEFDAELYNNNSNAAPRLTVLPFIPDVKQDEWLRLFGVDQLDRITQYAGETQVNILNMYNHQVECARHVESLEETERGGVPFDWIISTREDAHYFHDIDLQKLIIEEQDECDLITKNCLDFQGINMRFQLLRRQRGLHFLKTRLDFYKGMYTDNSTIRNPEMFEDKQANQQSSMIKVCKRPISDVPVNVGRHTTKGDLCFLPYEVEGCVPPEDVRYVNRKRCYPFPWKP
jgi:hypothetical protein